MKVALVGTDTFRGKEIKDVLEYKNIPFERIEFFDPDVEGEYSKLTEFRGEARVIHSLDTKAIVGSDLVFLASDKETNREYGRLAAQNQFLAVDLSETFNKEKNIPLVVAGVNHNILQKKPPIVANPHPATIILSHLFHVLLREFGVSKAVAFVLQPVSAYDEQGIEELANQSVAVLGSSSVSKNIFNDQIAFNLLSHTEAMDKDGFSGGEKQILSETRRVLHIPDFPLSLSLIQAPIFHTYSIMIHLELEKKTEIQVLEDLFKQSDYFQVASLTSSRPVSSVWVAGKNEIFIGQIKREQAFPNRFWIWAVADNLTRGSALNAFEILEQCSRG